MNIQEALTQGKAGKIIGRGEAGFPSKGSIFYAPAQGDGKGFAGFVLEKFSNSNFPTSVSVAGVHINGGWFHYTDLDGYTAIEPHTFTEADIMAADWFVFQI